MGIEKLNPGAREVLVTACMGAALVGGYATGSAITEAIEADINATRHTTQAEVYEVVGQPDEASRLQAQAKVELHDRNDDLLIACGTFIGASVFFGAGCRVINADSRRRKREAQASSKKLQ